MKDDTSGSGFYEDLTRINEFVTTKVANNFLEFHLSSIFLNSFLSFTRPE